MPIIDPAKQAKRKAIRKERRAKVMLALVALKTAMAEFLDDGDSDTDPDSDATEKIG